jgi:hypothetical protein
VGQDSLPEGSRLRLAPAHSEAPRRIPESPRETLDSSANVVGGDPRPHLPCYLADDAAFRLQPCHGDGSIESTCASVSPESSIPAKLGDALSSLPDQLRASASTASFFIRSRSLRSPSMDRTRDSASARASLTAVALLGISVGVPVRRASLSAASALPILSPRAALAPGTAVSGQARRQARVRDGPDSTAKPRLARTPRRAARVSVRTLPREVASDLLVP